jgi:hypothetical protein
MAASGAPHPMIIGNGNVSELLKRFRKVTIRNDGGYMFQPGDGPLQILSRCLECLSHYGLKGTDPCDLRRQGILGGGGGGAPCKGCKAPFETMKFFTLPTYRECSGPLEIHGAATDAIQLAYFSAGYIEVTAHFTLGPQAASLKGVIVPGQQGMTLSDIGGSMIGAEQEQDVEAQNLAVSSVTVPVVEKRMPSFGVLFDILQMRNEESIAHKICNMFENQLVLNESMYSPFCEWAHDDLSSILHNESQVAKENINQKLNYISNSYVYLIKNPDAMAAHVKQTDGKKTTGIGVLRKEACSFVSKCKKDGHLSSVKLPRGNSIFVIAIAVAKEEVANRPKELAAGTIKAVEVEAASTAATAASEVHPTPLVCCL